MLQFIMDQNLFLYLCGVACALGVVSQFLLKYMYGRLIGETSAGGEPKGKFLRQLRQRFQNCTHLNEKVNDITSFIDRSIMDYEFWNMNLHQWRRIGAEALTICLLCCGGGLWLLYRNGAEVSLQTSYSRAALISSLLILLSYGITDNRYQHHSLHVRLMDYLQNTGAIKSYGEVDFSTGASEGIKEAAVETAAAETAAASTGLSRKLRRASGESISETRAQRDKRQLKENLMKSKIGAQESAAAQEQITEREKNRKLLQQMDPKEKEQILREVLMEFLT